MASSLISYLVNDNTVNSSWNPARRAQTFTTVGAITVTSIKLKIYRLGDPGTVTVALYATTAGKPSGAAIVSNDFTGTDLPTSADWYEFDITDTELAASTMYAIVVYCTSLNSSNSLKWRIDAADSTYTGGDFCYSNDAGSNWDIGAGADFMFDVWGETEGGVLVSMHVLRLLQG